MLLCFHLLFMGRHPFAGRYRGKGDMPIERAIRECRFAFGRHAITRQMEPPPHTLPFAALPSVVADLFDLCRGTDPGRRGADEITLFKSVGTALEDLAAARLVWSRVAGA